MTGSETEFEHVADLIPPDCHPLTALRLVEFVRPDGSTSLQYALDSPTEIKALLGAISIVQHQLINEFFPGAAEKLPHPRSR